MSLRIRCEGGPLDGQRVRIDTKPSRGLPRVLYVAPDDTVTSVDLATGESVTIASDSARYELVSGPRAGQWAYRVVGP